MTQEKLRSLLDQCVIIYLLDFRLKCWSAFDPTALKNCTFDFGVAEIKKLCMQYEDLISVTNDNLIIKRYNDFKFLMSEKLISGTIVSLPEIAEIIVNDKQFNLLSNLVDICCTFQASSADCERGFSLMNNIKVKSRNSLGQRGPTTGPRNNFVRPVEQFCTIQVLSIISSGNLL